MTDKKKKPDMEPVDMDQEVVAANDAPAEEIAASPGESTEVETLRSELEDYKKKYLRAIADYQNFERRMMEERKEMRNIIKADVITLFLPTLDMLHKAELFIKDPGLKMIMDQFSQTFEQTGVKEIEVMGKEFDPNVAEVIDVVDGDRDNIVTEVLRKGYALNGNVIQHAQVKVSKKHE